MTTTFGRDISCTTSLRTGRYATGVRLVAEAAYRRLTTPRGMLHGDEDEKNYGIDLLDLIGSIQTKSDEAAMPGRIAGELRKDERILAVDVTLVSRTEGPSLKWTITIEATTAAGPFSLQVGVDDVSVELLNIRTEA